LKRNFSDIHERTAIGTVATTRAEGNYFFGRPDISGRSEISNTKPDRTSFPEMWGAPGVLKARILHQTLPPQGSVTRIMQELFGTDNVTGRGNPGWNMQVNTE
jgi:hypothetical protein